MADRPRLLVRADAGPDVGAGHLVRCFALAQAWRERGGEAHFVLGTDAARLAGGLVDLDEVVLHEVEAAPSGAADVRQTLDVARRISAAWLVVDGYRFGSSYQRELKEGGRPLLVIDDLGTAGHYHADLVLNPNFHARSELYPSLEPTTELLLGTEYTLLRRQFRNRRLRPVREVGERLLVAVGANDPGGLLPAIVRALAGAETGGPAIVAVGTTRAGEEWGETGPAGTPRPRVEHLARVSDMAGVMVGVDMALVAAGSIVWELAALGVPTLAFSRAPQETELLAATSRIGLTIDLGGADELDYHGLAETVGRLAHQPNQRQKMREIATRTVDGEGAPRVAARLWSGA